MFVQVIRGKVSDPAAMRERLASWQRDLAPGAKGWLGATMGTTDDGTYVNVVRFESEDAAKANSDRPEQGEWFSETKQHFEGEPTFYNCPEADVFLGGGSDDAGFVQVMFFKPSDTARLRELTKEFERLTMSRPEIMGGSIAYATDGTAIQTVYFASEEQARKGEQEEPAENLRPVLEEWRSIAGDVEYIDLHEPTLASP